MSSANCIAGLTDADYVVVRFSTADYAPRERFAAWREIYGRTLQKLDIEPLSGKPIYAEATLARMPGLRLMAARRSAAIYNRRREFIDHGDVGVMMGLTSSYEVHHLGRRLAMRRGDAIIMTGTEPAWLRVPVRGEYINLRVPVRALSPLVADLGGTYGRPIRSDNQALKLLIRYVGLLEETEAFAVPYLRRQAIIHIHDLIALAMGATRDATEVAKSRGARAARLSAIKADIANQVERADLSVASIAAQHGIVPRYIQRLFEGEGTTFTDYVLTQRLACAHRILSDPRTSGRKISTIAFDVGFGDLSYFNRAFRRRYGATPSDLRAAKSAD